MSAFGIGTPELIFIVIIILIVFGPGRLPQISRDIGKAVREFKKASSEITSQVSRAIEEMPETKTATDLPAQHIDQTQNTAEKVEKNPGA